MNTNKLHPALLAVICAGLLSACGGGGDNNAGATAALSVFPASSTFTAPSNEAAGICVAGGSSLVQVHGGAAPYRITNLDPANLSVDTTQVGHPDGTFTVLVIRNSCLTNDTITIEDSLNNTIVFTITNAPNPTPPTTTGT